MTQAKISVVHFPIRVTAEPQSGGHVAIVLSDASDELLRELVQTSEAEAVHKRLSELGARLVVSRDVLRSVLSGRIPSGSARPLASPNFDGCEPASSGSSGYDSEEAMSGLGCAVLVVILLFFILPTLALILAGLLVLVFAFIVLGALLAGTAGLIGNAVVELDKWNQCVRVLPSSMVTGHDSANGALGVALLHASTWPQYSEKFVVFASVEDRIVLATAEGNSRRAAKSVGREALRQRRHVQDLRRAAEKADAEARAVARKINSQ